MKPVVLAAASWLMLTGSANAQQVEQFASGLSTAVEGLGQGVAGAMTSGETVFVTATGRAPLPAPLTDAYVINIEGRSASAVEAATLRDQRLSATRALAQRLGVTVEIGSSAFAREQDYQAAASAASAEASANAASAAASLNREPPPLYIKPVRAPGVTIKVFSVKTSVRFRSDDPRRLPAFLDALTAAGVDSTFSGQDRNAGNIFAGMGQALGFGPVAKIDDAVWDRASQSAVVEARRQASVIASAANRQIGEARQILLLNRNVQGDSASVTVAVRFALSPSR